MEQYILKTTVYYVLSIYSMKYIVNVIRRFTLREQPKVLGRWNLEYSNCKLNKKIELANKDNCFGYDEYAVKQTNLNKFSK